MLDQLKQLMEAKRQAEQLKKQLESSDIEINDVKGIKLVINGTQSLKFLELDDELLHAENKKKLEADLLRAFNVAVAKSQVMAAQKMKALTGLNIPGL